MTSRHEDGSWRGLPTYEDPPRLPEYREFVLVILPEDCFPETFYEIVIGEPGPERSPEEWIVHQDKRWKRVVEALEDEDVTSEMFFESARKIEGIGIYEVDVKRNSYFPARNALLLAKGKAFDDYWSPPCQMLFLEVVNGKIERGL